MKLTEDILQLKEYESGASEVVIDIGHIVKHTTIKSDFQSEDKMGYSRKIYEIVLGHEFKEDDILIAHRPFGSHAYNGYDIFFRIKYVPVLQGWTKTLGEALMIQDWIVKS